MSLPTPNFRNRPSPQRARDIQRRVREITRLRSESRTFAAYTGGTEEILDLRSAGHIKHVALTLAVMLRAAGKTALNVLFDVEAKRHLAMLPTLRPRDSELTVLASPNSWGAKVVLMAIAAMVELEGGLDITLLDDKVLRVTHAIKRSDDRAWIVSLRGSCTPTPSPRMKGILPILTNYADCLILAKRREAGTWARRPAPAGKESLLIVATAKRHLPSWKTALAPRNVLVDSSFDRVRRNSRKHHRVTAGKSTRHPLRGATREEARA